MKNSRPKPNGVALWQAARDQALAYRQQFVLFTSGQTPAAEFKAYQAGMGIYEERTAGQYMVRARLTAGVALPQHLRALAQLSRQYGSGILHLTTRQDIQIHGVSLQDVPEVVEHLLVAGLATRGGGGNTVRNISASVPGACPNDKFDVAPYALALTEYLLQYEGSFTLPRKFKIAFSGCEDDCAFASITDLGFFAQFRDGAPGFSVYVGGGMGRNPRPAMPIEPFVSPHEIFEIAEAVRRLFDRHGDRANRHRARLRFVVERVGEEAFKQLYFEERAALRAEGMPGSVPPVPQADPVSGSNVVVRLPLGDILADNLVHVANLAEQNPPAIVRATQRQDLVLTAIPAESKASIVEALRALNIGSVDQPSLKIVACTGAGVCRLGLCNTRELAAHIAEAFADSGLVFKDAQVIRISGCPNSCGGHQTAAIGLEGGMKMLEGQVTPVYSVFVDGKVSSGGATLAQKIATVPASRIPDLLVKAFLNRRIDTDKLRHLAPHYEERHESTL